VGLWQFYRSTIGKKIIMALTGLILVAFVIVHMLGNLLIFAGPERLNAYSHFLHASGELLWLVRIVLLLAVVLHIDAAVQLTRRSLAARPVAYDEREPQVSTLAARTIRWGGALLLVFVVFHLLHFTTGTLLPVFHPGDVFTNVVTGFRVWPVAVFYVIAMGALGLHLYHGAWSSIHTLGLTRPSRHPLRRPIATVLAIVVAAGFALVPIAVLAGWVK
jgi:succinate dehydrogenase / fumarate reductase, cytochrome b subunit